MTDFGLFTLFLFLHVISAVVAFGPAFIFPIIGAFGSREPAHGNFALRLGERITDRVVIPVALTMPVTGLFLIWFGHVNLADRTGWWLAIAIVLYIGLLSVGIGVQRPAVIRMVQLTSAPPPGAGGPPQAGGPPAAGGPGGGAPTGPPPAVLALGAEIRRNGMIMTTLIVLIVLMMVSRPQF